MLKSNETEAILKGIGASPGICIGKAYIVDHEGVDVVEKYYISKKKLPCEISRFKAAIKKTRDELRELIKNTHEDLFEHAYIFETHMMLLRDKRIYDKIIETCEKEHVNAEWALKKVTSNLKLMFLNIANPYLKARFSDVMQVSDRVMRNLTGIKKEDISEIKKRVILVAYDLSPAETSQIQLEKIKGVVTNRGGRTSHTSIIARALGIPAVLGTANATDLIQNDDLIIIDGSTGKVILNPTEQTIALFHDRQIRYEKFQAEITRQSKKEVKTTDDVPLKIMGNIELPEEVFSVLSFGGDGIGLYRTEFQYLSSTGFPNEDALFDKYKDVVEVMAPKPVTIRTLDINGDKAISCNSAGREANPALGLRAIRYCLEKPEVFKTQLRAILRAAAFGNVRIIFPMISGVEEIIEAKKMLDNASESLYKEGAVFERNIKIGIMVEVPSAVIMADIMAEFVDFFSIGTNDLIQYSLAIDRDNKDVAYLYNPLHPAILRMLKQVTDVAREKNVGIYMCGEMASDPIHIPILIGMGIEEFSMTPQSIPVVKRMIKTLNKEDTKSFVKDVLRQTTAADVAGLVDDAYGAVISDGIYNETD